jgi:hypothetical protein
MPKSGTVAAAETSGREWVGALLSLDASNVAWVEAVDSPEGTFALKVRAADVRTNGNGLAGVGSWASRRKIWSTWARGSQRREGSNEVAGWAASHAGARRGASRAGPWRGRRGAWLRPQRAPKHGRRRRAHGARI